MGYKSRLSRYGLVLVLIAVAALVFVSQSYSGIDSPSTQPPKPVKKAVLDEPPAASALQLSIEKWISTSGGIGGIALSPDCRTLYAAYWGNASGSPIEEYNLATGQKVRSFNYDDRHNHGDMVVSPDGRYLFTTNYYYTHASRIDLVAQKETGVDLGGVKTAVWAGDLDMAPNGQIVVVAVGRDGRNYNMQNDQLSILDVSGGNLRLMAEVKLPDEPSGHKIGFSADSRFAYVVTRAQSSSSPRLYEVALTTPKVMRHIDFPNGVLNGVAVSSRDQRIYVSDSISKTIHVVNLSTMTLEREFSLDGHAPGTILLSGDGKYLYVLCPETRILKAVDTKTGNTAFDLKGLKRSPRDIELTPDNKTLYIAHQGEEGGICVVRVSSTVASSEVPNPAGRNNYVVFSSDREGNYQLFKISADGAEPIRLTNNTATETCPRWSPDGGEIAFISNRNGPFRICTMRDDGSGNKCLENTDPNNGDVHGGAPLDWSPDGRSFVFINKDHTAIKIVDRNGASTKTLVSGAVGSGYSYYSGVSWKRPDKIVFNAQNPAWGYDQDIFSVSPTSGTISQLTNEKGKYTPSSSPDLSPDGNRIVLVRQVGKDPPPRNTYILEVGNHQLRKITDLPGIDAVPRWSRIRDKIVLCSGSSERKHIWVLNPDGTDLKQLTFGDSDDVQPDIR